MPETIREAPFTAEETGHTIYELAQRAGATNFDAALPQQWLDAATKILGESPYRHFVWEYGSRSVFGGPFPITESGRRMAAALVQSGLCTAEA